MAGFQSAQATLDKHNVSLIEATMGVNYLPYVAPVVPQHDYVEIGAVKWATMNIGANSITDTGLYFQCDDTQGYTTNQVGNSEGKKAFSLADYKWTEDGGSTMSKYNATDNKTVLDIEDDAVAANWGGQWSMPTTEELQALGNAVNVVWTENYNGSGINGLLCTDKTDSSKTLFFPFVHAVANGGNLGNNCEVWSSSLYTGNTDYAYSLSFTNRYTGYNSSQTRDCGFSVRGVVG